MLFLNLVFKKIKLRKIILKDINFENIYDHLPVHLSYFIIFCKLFFHLAIFKNIF